MMDMHIRRVGFLIIKTLFLAMILIFTIVPFVWVILSSFKTNDEILISSLSLPSKWTLDGYKRAFDMAPILTFFRNSVIVSLSTTVLAIAFFSMGAYVLARMRGRFVRVIVAVLSMSLYIPVSALVQPVFLLVEGLGMYNHPSGLILVNIAMNLAISVFILRATFLAIPIEIEESAYIDGASVIRTFFSIVLPTAKSGQVTVGILCFINSWNQFMFPLVLTSQEESFTLPLALNYFTAAFRFDYPALFAALTITVLPTIIIFFLMSDRIIAGMAGGAIKG